jgi:hypothetical protein
MAMVAVLGGLFAGALVLAGVRSAVRGKKTKPDTSILH